MMIRQEGHGSFAKQFLKVGSNSGMMKVIHLHSQHEYSSGENLSPRSVLEQTALSGLAIAIDLGEKEKLSHTQENIILGRFFCHNLTVGRSLSRERLSHMKQEEEREAVLDEPIVGLRMVASLCPMLHMSNQGHGVLIKGRSVSRERMKSRESMKQHMVVHMTYGERERLSESSMVGLREVASERKEGNSCTLHMEVPLPNVEKLLPPSTCKSLPGREGRRGWLHLHGHHQAAEGFPSASMEDSIFYCASSSSSSSSSSNTSYSVIDDDEHACSPVEDFLKLCFFCKCCLGVGKDIFMYRGDQAFCSAECRYQQIMNDESMGSSAS